METVIKGSVIMGADVFRFAQDSWMHVYHVLDVEPMTLRFGKPNRILTVRIETTNGHIVDYTTKRWFTQLS
jgi:hypothetical protein